MKIRVTFKSPDVVDDAVESAWERLMSDEELEDAADCEEEREEFVREKKEFIKQWIKYGEYAVIEFDTEARTAVVVRNQ